MKSIFLLIFCFAFIVLCSAVEETDNTDVENISSSRKDTGLELQISLYSAIEDGNLSEVQSILDRGYQSNVYYFTQFPDRFNDQLTHSIYPRAYKGNFDEEIFKLFLKNVTNLEYVDHFGRTPLYYAIETGCVKAVKILLEHGANPNTFDQNEYRSYNTTALQKAFYSGGGDVGEEIIVLLIEHGADVNVTDEYGQTPLHKSILKGHKKTIEMLIERGANVNAVENRWNMTPLHFVAVFDSDRDGVRWNDDDSLKYAEMLIDHGADLSAKAHYKDHDGTALDLAENSKLRKLLGSKMGAWEWLKTRW